MSAAIYVPATWANGASLSAFRTPVVQWASAGAYQYPAGPRSTVLGIIYGRPRAIALAAGPD